VQRLHVLRRDGSRIHNVTEVVVPENECSAKGGQELSSLLETVKRDRDELPWLLDAIGTRVGDRVGARHKLTRAAPDDHFLKQNDDRLGCNHARPRSFTGFFCSHDM